MAAKGMLFNVGGMEQWQDGSLFYVPLVGKLLEVTFDAISCEGRHQRDVSQAELSALLTLGLFEVARSRLFSWLLVSEP